MNKVRRVFYINFFLVFLTLFACQSAFAKAEPNPNKVYFTGPVPWNVAMVNCGELGPDPVLVEMYIEELWGHIQGVFLEGFEDASGGVHVVQPAHWIMSAISSGETYSWWGRASARFGSNGPSKTAGGNQNYIVNSKLRADGDWPDLHLKQHFNLVVNARGELKVFNDLFEISCHN